MPGTARDRQISVRIARDTDAWLEVRAGSSKNKAGFIRQLIERERARKGAGAPRHFNAAAKEISEEDLWMFDLNPKKGREQKGVRP